jgi:hypothetical protein
MAANPMNAKKRIISKSFHRILDTYNRQTFTGERGAATRRMRRVSVPGRRGVSLQTAWHMCRTCNLVATSCKAQMVSLVASWWCW